MYSSSTESESSQKEIYLPVVLNPTARTKKEVVAKPRDDVRFMPVPLNMNGFVVCGIHNHTSEPKCLIVVDFDVKEGAELQMRDLMLHILPETLVVKTPSGGYHVYLYIEDGEIRNYQFRNITQYSSVVGIKEVDIRGEGGIAIAPGTILINEKGEEVGYETMVLKEPATITSDDLIKYLSIFIIQKTEEETKPTPIFGEKLEEYIRDLPIRRAFKDILRGTFIIEHGQQKSTGIEEFQYWAALWRELLWAKIDPETIFPILETTQPEFSLKKTREQLKYLSNKDKRPSSEFYARLFPNYKGDVIDELLTQNKLLLKRIERLENTVNEILIRLLVRKK